jgi:hypothetical protein
MPTGQLAVRAYSPYDVVKWKREWRESDPGGVVRRLPAIAEELENEAPKIVSLYEEGQREAQRRRKEWEVESARLERERRERQYVKAVEKSREELLGIIDSWRLAKSIEEFVVDAEERARELPPNEREAVLARLEAGRVSLGNIDVLTRFKSWKAPEEYDLKGYW